jgi:energy-coupling factor transport system substrate-specific component
VTWTAAVFAILAAALAAGYAWYERAQPTARLAAMVATMAGLAALGRIAFAPLPDVKPTTDIIVLSGFVLGAAPGFAIGATGALASNVVFGQGPWTPWQMAAWGLTGLLGAALGAVTRRDVGRIPLALFCGAMGVLFGAIMDFSTLASYTGEHSLDRYLAISGTALPFNVAHAVGNIAFCLAFGPALVRALERFRARLHITWIPLEVTRS